jgi:hypothetical protein
MRRFGDYIVYVDESGDHSLENINPQFPVFVLAFCIFPVKEYVQRIVPAIEQLKFDFFGHDMVILHEREIRKETPPFHILQRSEVRDEFMARINTIIIESRFEVVASVIDKEAFREHSGSDGNPYHIALEFGLERISYQLRDRQQESCTTHIVFESRGRTEDSQLELEFRRLQNLTRIPSLGQTLEFMCVSKSTNSSGLQLADMIARPIGIHVLRPHQSNRAWKLIETKMVKSETHQLERYGLKIYP